MRAATLAVFLLISSVAVAQTTRNVPAQFATIQAAIVASVNGDTVLVAPGTYNDAINFLGKAITVVSSGGPASTSIVGTSAGRVVTFATNEGVGSVLQGFTITGGAGGIRCFKASPQIINCTITGNTTTTSPNGGGILIHADAAGSQASPTLQNCRVIANSALNSSGPSGGGIHCTASNGGSSSPSLTGCTIANNYNAFANGGGIYISRSEPGVLSLTMTECVVKNNACMAQGGGIRADSFNTLTLTRCRIQDNNAITGPNNSGSYAGGLSFGGGVTVNVIGCIISGNSASFSGGGVYAVLGNTQTVTFQGCTIVNNSSFGIGGISAVGGGAMTIVGSIIWGNSSPGIGSDAQAIVSVINSNLQFPSIGAGATNISLDPRFIDPSSGDFHLTTTSPCVNTGSIGVLPAPTLDIDGSPRIVGTIDMGADEVPVLTLPGSGDDLDLYTWLDGTGDPLATTHSAPAGTTVTFTMKSPGGTLNGALPLLAGEFFMPAFPPMGLVAYPFVHLDNGLAFLIAGSFGAGPFASPGLDPDGITITTLVPTGLGGFGVRLQGFAVTPFVSNGLFAASNAHDILF